MIVNVAFFSGEPIENIITCLNYQVDKVIFFGYCDVMTKRAKDGVGRLLQETCGVKEIEFRELRRNSFTRTVNALEGAAAAELEKGNQCFLDLTGGGELFLVAGGAIASGRKLSMHCFDVETNAAMILNAGEAPCIKDIARSRRTRLKLKDLLSLGGTAVANHKKAFHGSLYSEEFRNDAEKIWEIAEKDFAAWNELANILKEFEPEEDAPLKGRIRWSNLERTFSKFRRIKDRETLAELLGQLEGAGVIGEKKIRKTEIGFAFKSAGIRACLQDPGSILAVHGYLVRRQDRRYQDCRVSVRLSRDGAEQSEADMLLLEGNTPVFVACRSGSVSRKDLAGLREAAGRFGGKYARAELVTAKKLSKANRLCAEEMNIKVTQV